MRRLSALACVLLSSLSSLVFAGEPLGEKATSADTTAVEEAMLSYLETDEELKGGFSLMFDAVEDAPVTRGFTRQSHTANKLNDGTFLVCADFTDAVGSLFDLDFYVAGNPNDHDPLRVERIIIHKVDGIKRENND